MLKTLLPAAVLFTVVALALGATAFAQENFDASAYSGTAAR
jgi:hypothetical protein